MHGYDYGLNMLPFPILPKEKLTYVRNIAPNLWPSCRLCVCLNVHVLQSYHHLCNYCKVKPCKYILVPCFFVGFTVLVVNP